MNNSLFEMQFWNASQYSKNKSYDWNKNLTFSLFIWDLTIYWDEPMNLLLSTVRINQWSRNLSHDIVRELYCNCISWPVQIKVGSYDIFLLFVLLFICLYYYCYYNYVLSPLPFTDTIFWWYPCMCFLLSRTKEKMEKNLFCCSKSFMALNYNYAVILN